jgi:hypothetical protein
MHGLQVTRRTRRGSCWRCLGRSPEDEPLGVDAEHSRERGSTGRRRGRGTRSARLRDEPLVERCGGRRRCQSRALGHAGEEVWRRSSQGFCRGRLAGARSLPGLCRGGRASGAELRSGEVHVEAPRARCRCAREMQSPWSARRRGEIRRARAQARCQIRGRRRNYVVSHLIKSFRSRRPQTHFFASGVCGISGRRCHFHPDFRVVSAGPPR